MARRPSRRIACLVRFFHIPQTTPLRVVEPRGGVVSLSPFCGCFCDREGRFSREFSFESQGEPRGFMWSRKVSRVGRGNCRGAFSVVPSDPFTYVRIIVEIFGRSCLTCKASPCFLAQRGFFPLSSSGLIMHPKRCGNSSSRVSNICHCMSETLLELGIRTALVKALQGRR